MYLCVDVYVIHLFISYVQFISSTFPKEILYNICFKEV